jgi:isoleucyl-tRNA synthetase
VTVTEELRKEGVARELVNRIQNIRKSSGLEITDKICITLSKDEHINEAVAQYGSYICNQVLAVQLDLVDAVADGTELDMDDYKLTVSVKKA